MTYQTPAARRESVERVLEALQGARRVVLTTHLNADGDGAGSEAALASWLRQRGTEAWIVNPTPFPTMFSFLLEDPSWVVEASDPRAAERCAAADTAVVLDTGEASRLGRVKPLLDSVATVVVVDHHPPGEGPIQGISLRDPSACAAGELVHDVVLAADGPWTEPVVRGIYVAIVTDTGSFRFANSSSASHRIVADLIDLGVDPEEVSRQVYGASPLRRFHLLRDALAYLEVDEGGSVAWMTVPKEAYDALEAEPDDLEGLVDYPRSVEGVEVALLFRRTGAGATKVSLRSTGLVDVNVLARRFGGGGHVRASGALVHRPLEEVRREVVEAAREAVSAARRAAGNGA